MSSLLRPLGEADYDWVLALSAQNEVETGKLDRGKLAGICGSAYLVLAAGERDGYIIAFDQDAPYASPNFLWHKARWPRFVYVDRIVIAAGARRAGLARATYEALFDRAKGEDHAVATCEVNLDPPNPNSDAFHARLGFTEVGRATLADGKVVRYLARRL